MFPTGDHKIFGNFKCGDGCLFRLDVDPSEYVDLAVNETSTLNELAALRADAVKTVFQPKRGTSDAASCVKAITEHGGFWGPWVDAPMSSIGDAILV